MSSVTLATDALVAAQPAGRTRAAGGRLPARWVAALIGGDIIAFLAASAAGVFYVQRFWNATINVDRAALSAAVFVSLWLVVFELLGLYRRSFALSVRDEMYYTVAALCTGVVPVFALFTAVPSISTSRAALIASLIMSIVLVGGYRAVAHAVRDAVGRRERRICLVGRAERLDDLVDTMRRQGRAHVYWLAVPDLDVTLAGVELFGPNAFDEIPWLRQALAYGIDQLVFTEILPPTVVPHLLAAGQRYGIQIAFAPPRVKAHAYSLEVEMVGHQTMLVPKPLVAVTPRGRLAKRVFDLAVASFALLLLAPVMVTVAIAIRVLDPSGPVLYRQTRVGRDGKPFDIFKFRTMRTDAEREGARFATQGDPRVTPIGRFLRRTSLDELPQLFNVILGDMSIVGPRPERPVFVDGFRRDVPRYDERHLVKPGITGWAQVHMKRVLNGDDVHDKLYHDLFYVEHWSPFVDVSVCLKTGAEVLFHRAA